MLYCWNFLQRYFLVWKGILSNSSYLVVMFSIERNEWHSPFGSCIVEECESGLCILSFIPVSTRKSPKLTLEGKLPTKLFLVLVSDCTHLLNGASFPGKVKGKNYTRVPRMSV